MNIYEKMSAITTELTAVAKNLTVGVGKSAYKAVGEADVLAAVKPLEAKHGIYSYPIAREIIKDDVMTTRTEYDGKVTERQNQFMRIAVTYRFVNTEKSEEYIDIVSYGDGVDSQDKAPGKAMTYADKYALLKAYKIITGEDPDQNYSENGKFKKSEKKEDKKPNALTSREKVIIFAKENNIPFNELAKDYGLSGSTTEERFAEVLKDLEGK